ncbi:ABC transporter ATP-binding protein [Paenarthrobacter sp. CM16]|uniref:ABC transporter ATP-binding protein n=1 Tax=Paenarthrobacter sp. CM16 TaxID=2738447 RepID=UPI001C1326A9|nr:ABC transporter ATP-binding protein [Paenarthrobacter sp. CM16]
MITTNSPLLSVRNLNIDVATGSGRSRVVSEVSFELRKGETVGIVGESGSGKSMTANAIMGILPDVATATGTVQYDGTELLSLSSTKRRKMSGPGIGYIFQEPMSALHPLLTIGEQMIRPLRYHLKLTKQEASRRAADLLDQVGIPPSRGVLRSHIHELSGGMRQRVMIAMAISCQPRLLIADEPTTALDATVQKQILDLLVQLRDDMGLALVLISHDLGLIAKYSDQVVVMLEGNVMEQGATSQIIHSPAHPYTRGLMDASPRLGQKQHRLPVIDKSKFTKLAPAASTSTEEK